MYVGPMLRGWVLAMVLALALPAAAMARAGDLDPSFGGGDGKVTASFGAGSLDEAKDVAVRPDGRIVLAGTSDVNGNNDFALARLTPQGALDPLFGAGGLSTGSLTGSATELGQALVLQGDGKPIVAGSSNPGQQYAVMRF